MAFPAKGTLSILANAGGITGYVKHKKGKLIVDRELLLYGRQGIKSVALEQNGYFTIAPHLLVGSPGQNQSLVFGAPINEQHSITFNTYAHNFDLRFNASVPQSVLTPMMLGNTKMERISFEQKVQQLREVTVKGQKGEIKLPKSMIAKPFKSTTCNDYVCFYNILNCQNHTSGSPPVDGELYILNGAPVIYQSCQTDEEKKSNLIPIKLISLPNDFYQPNYEREKINSPELLNTLYWNPLLKNDGKTAEFEFYTSDITGVFQIIIQGFEARNGILNGRTTFEVR